MNKKFHFLYKVTNIVNDKYYIGIHSTNDLNDGYMGSGIMLQKSIKKYGIKNFQIEILNFVDNREDLKILENKIVNDELLKDILCMNLQIGGTSGFDYIKMKRETDPIYDYIFREMQSEKLKLYHKDGKIKYDTFTGRKHKTETINKFKGHKRQIGVKNSQFGTCWIINDNETKKIKKEDLTIYLNDGWRKGRK